MKKEKNRSESFEGKTKKRVSFYAKIYIYKIKSDFYTN